MRQDVVDLRDFYATSRGAVARRMIRAGIRSLWPDVRGMTVLGLGYASPYLRMMKDEAERIIAVMTPDQGVLHWPTDAPNVTTLADESDLPLPDLSVDRILAVHAVEHSEQLRAALREFWRVLAGNGRLMVVVPNRRGIWARFDKTPFGVGYPYSVIQLTQVLRDNMFTPTRSARALYIPPIRLRTVLASAAAWENIGSRWFPGFGGVILVEASKQLYSATPEPRRARIVVPARPVRFPVGASRDH
jgi:SAM-dependent methyltransferase